MNNKPSKNDFIGLLLYLHDILEDVDRSNYNEEDERVFCSAICELSTNHPEKLGIEILGALYDIYMDEYGVTLSAIHNYVASQYDLRNIPTRNAQVAEPLRTLFNSWTECYGNNI